MQSPTILTMNVEGVAEPIFVYTNFPCVKNIYNPMNMNSVINVKWLQVTTDTTTFTSGPPTSLQAPAPTPGGTNLIVLKPVHHVLCMTTMPTG